MDEPAFVDLLDLDRRMARACERVAHFHEACRSPEGWRAAESFDPFAGHRVVATLGTFRELHERSPSLSDVLLRDALVRWTAEMLQERVGLELALADVRARSAVDERATRRRLTEASSDVAPGFAATFVEAERALFAAADAPRASVELARLAELAPPVAAVRKERRARRFEAARRLGLAHPWSLVTSRPMDELASRARAFLDRTEPLAEEILRVAKKHEAAPWTAASAMQLGFAREASHGWPAGLHARWLSDTFAALAPPSSRGHRPPRLPRALGGASFLRAAYAWGHSLRLAGAPRALPFALASDPYAASAHRWGFALALAASDPIFQRRILDVSPRFGATQVRVLHRSMLLHARWLAARLLLVFREQVDASLFEELGARVFGAPLPSTLRDAWPEPRVDEAARLVAMFQAHGFVRDLVGRFDEDWFRNPRAGAHLAGLASAPVFDDLPVDDGVDEAMARAFEEALG